MFSRLFYSATPRTSSLTLAVGVLLSVLSGCGTQQPTPATGSATATAPSAVPQILAPKAPEPQWLPAFNGKDMTGWEVERPGQEKIENGILELNNFGATAWSIRAQDMTIRARVSKKPNAHHVGLGLRDNPNGGYHFYFVGHEFGIGKFVGQGSQAQFSQILAVPATTAYEDFFELSFSAVGDTLTGYANGKQIMQVRDASHTSGSPSLAASQGPGQFKNVEVSILRAAPNEPAAPPRQEIPVAAQAAPANTVSPSAAGEQPVGEVRRFTGHTGGIWSVALSPDGRQALSGGGLYLSDNVVERAKDFAMRLWDVESGKEIKRFEGHTDTVRCVAFSPDGQRALSASWDKTIRLWDVQTGRELQRLVGHTDKIAASVFSPNGTQVLSGGVDMTIRLWDAASGQQLQRFDEPSRQVHGLAFSPDGSRFLVGSVSVDSKGAGLDGVVSLRDAKTGELVRRFEEPHATGLHCLSFSPDGRRALSAGTDWVMRLWDVDTGKLLKRMEGHTACFTFDGRRALANQRDKSLVLWDLESGSELCRFLNVGTISIACSPDGRHALSGSSDKTLRLWRLPNPPPVASDQPAGEVRRFTGHTGAIWTVAFSPDGHQLWTGSQDGTVRSWDPDTGATVRQIDLRAGRVTRVAFAGDFRTVLTAQHPDKFARVWNTESGLEVRRLQGHASSVWSISLSPDGRRALAGAEDGAIRLWDVNTGNEIKSFAGHTGLVQSVVFSPDGRRALSGSQDKLVCLWDLETGKRLQTLPGHTGKVCSLAFSPDGRRAVSGGGGVDARGQPADTTVRVWDLEAGQELQCLRGHTNGVTGIAFTPDARHVISASYDKTVRVWDVQTGKELQRFEGHAKELECVGVSPDGRFAASGGHDTVVRLWRLPEPLAATAPKSEPKAVAQVSPATASVQAQSSAGSPAAMRARKPGEIWRSPDSSAKILASAFSPTGNYVAVTRDNQQVQLWPITETQDGQQSFTLRHPVSGNQPQMVTGVTFSPDGRWMSTGAVDGSIILWSLAGTPPTKAAELKPFDAVITALAFSPSGKLFAAGARKPGGSVQIWDVADPAKPRAVSSFAVPNPDEVSSLVFSNDSGTLCVGAGFGPRVYSTPINVASPTPRKIWSTERKGGWARSLHVSRDGKELGFAADDKAVILTLATNQVRLKFEGHEPDQPVIGFAFSPDGTRCLTAGADKTLRLWSAATGLELWQNDKPHGYNEGVSFSPDGRLAFTASKGGMPSENVAQLWRLPDPEPAQELQKLNGLWKFSKGEVNGKELSGELAEGRQILFTDGSYVQKFGGSTIEGSYQIDPTKNPKTIDFTPLKGGRAEAQGKPQLGIYELDGDTFRYCVAYSGNPRPTEFTTNKPNGGQALQVYVREKSE